LGSGAAYSKADYSQFGESASLAFISGLEEANETTRAAISALQAKEQKNRIVESTSGGSGMSQDLPPIPPSYKWGIVAGIIIISISILSVKK